MRDVTIVIPSWNGRHLLERFLPSVLAEAARYRAASDARVEVLVVDDGGTDGTPEWIEARAAEAAVPLRCLRRPENRGFGAACNAGVAAAAHELVFLLNNDVEVEPGALAPLVERFHSLDKGRPFAVHGRMVDLASGQEVGTGKAGGFARGFLRVHRSYVTRGAARAEPADLPSIFAGAGAALVDRAVFLELGGFDPLFAPFYFEDVELSYRAWKRGFTVGYEPRSVVRHQFSSTIAPLAGGRIQRVSHRNRLVLHWIHVHDRRLFAAHVGWVALLAVTAPLTLKFSFARGLIDAVGRLGEIKARRNRERRLAARTDREVLATFARLPARPDLQVYDSVRELAETKKRPA
jgi:GT2 family glycosyltransferase